MATLIDPFEFEQDFAPNTTRRVGLAIPFKASSTGGLLQIYADNNDTKAIVLALMSEQSENPFQQPTDPIEESLFDIADPTSIANVRRKLDLIFAEFEQQHRFRLLPDSVEIRSSQDGLHVFFFQYVNLESDQIQELALTL